MEILAFFGLVALLLSCAVTLVLPIALAIWVSPVWLWLYLVYVLFTIALFALFISYTDRKGKIGDR